MSTPTTVEKHAFQAEVQQLLQLMIHSLYSNKEIFLRELVSNASDACDRLRFLALTDKSLLQSGQALGIRVSIDAKKQTISIQDNGIGMSRDEVIENIGTIARSGTKAFLEQAAKGKQDIDSGMIGQFGVGFYSSFLVAKQVIVLTRRAGAPPSEGVKWVSDGSGEYTIEPIERPQQGTEVILSIHKDNQAFLEKFRVKSVLSKYSDHISLPIEMPKEPEQDQDGKQIIAPQTQWETVNKGSALWARPRNKITAEEHNAFYTSLTYDPEPPALTLHTRVEGKMEYISLLYIPSKAPYDLWDREQRNGIKLYVRRIFIADSAKQLMPNYLRFVRGLVDSADLPLNVSREFLQQTREIDKIRAALVKKVLGELNKIATKDADKYAALWQQYGKVIKEGLVEDMDNQDALAKLARFASTHNSDQTQSVSLDDYIARMPEQQKSIYFVTADSYQAAKSSPHLEVFGKNEIEVLLLSDPVDEWVVNNLANYQQKPLQSIARGDIDIDQLKGKDTAKKSTQKNQALQPFVDKFKTILEGKVKDVRLSNRLIDSPACLVADQFDMGGNMERILQAMGKDTPQSKPILEINPDHAIVKQIDIDADNVEDWAFVLLDQATLAEGSALQNPAAYVARINKLLAP